MPGMAEITADELEEYLTIREERSQLGRKDRSLGKRESQLHDKFKAAMQHDEKTHTTRYGHPMSLVEGQRYPKWKEAFIEKLGAEAAEEVEANTEPKSKVLVQPKAA